MTSIGSFPNPPRNLYDGFARSARAHPDRRVTLLDNRGQPNGQRTFAELADAGRLMARRLRQLGLEPGDRVLISLPTSWHWFDTWLGALYCRALPAAIAMPGALGSPRAQVEKIMRVCELIGARFLVGTESMLRQARLVLDGGEKVTSEGNPLTPVKTTLLDVAALGSVPLASPEPDPDPDPGEVAFLQLTSGSTGIPRAVEISHRAAVHNPLACAEVLAKPHGIKNDAIVSWLPLYHDMGLIGCVMNAILNGCDLDLLAPRTFLARPWLWLEALARRDAPMSAAPNFAYQLALERGAERISKDLSLSKWRDAMTGSEMVRPETVDAFCQTFAARGFRRSQLRPCYGLAEGTLAVTVHFDEKGVRTRPVPVESAALFEEPGVSEVVSNGVPIRDTLVQARGPQGEPCRTGTIGEIWIQGPGVMSGYFNDPVATTQALQDGWLDTGDLGFLDPEGELYLVGRSKEILILNGQNLMPHELEWVAEGVAGSGGAQRSAAFAIPSKEGEKAILVLECDQGDPDRLSELRADIATAIGRTLSIPLADLVLVKRGAIPRTSSGKIQRRAARSAYLNGSLGQLASVRR